MSDDNDNDDDYDGPGWAKLVGWPLDKGKLPARNFHISAKQRVNSAPQFTLWESQRLLLFTGSSGWIRPNYCPPSSSNIFYSFFLSICITFRLHCFPPFLGSASISGLSAHAHVSLHPLITLPANTDTHRQQTYFDSLKDDDFYFQY